MADPRETAERIVRECRIDLTDTGGRRRMVEMDEERLLAALAASAREVERLRERVGMATRFYVRTEGEGRGMIRVTVELESGGSWLIWRRRLDGGGHSSPHPGFPTADAAFAALSAASPPTPKRDNEGTPGDGRGR